MHDMVFEMNNFQQNTTKKRNTNNNNLKAIHDARLTFK